MAHFVCFTNLFKEIVSLVVWCLFSCFCEEYWLLSDCNGLSFHLRTSTITKTFCDLNVIALYWRSVDAVKDNCIASDARSVLSIILMQERSKTSVNLYITNMKGFKDISYLWLWCLHFIHLQMGLEFIMQATPEAQVISGSVNSLQIALTVFNEKENRRIQVFRTICRFVDSLMLYVQHCVIAVFWI